MLLTQDHYNQITPNPVPHDLVSLNNGNRGETSPEVRSMLNDPYGRNLAGLGRTDYAGDAEYEDDALDRLASQDDVVGSGIFDAAGADATIHPDLGVFADHPNLPGYIAREVQFEPNKDVESLPSGADIIGIPGGGMSWGGRTIGPGTYGEHVPYRYGSQIPQPGSPLRQVPAVSPGAAIARPQAVPPVNTTPVLPQASIQKVPTVHSKVQQLRPVVPVMTTGARGVSRAAVDTASCKPCQARAPRPPQRVQLARTTNYRAMNGMGATNGDKDPSWVPYVVGSALIGAAVALFWGTLKIKPGKGK